MSLFEKNTQQLTLAEVSRPLIQFCARLIGKDGRAWLDAFKRFLRKENPWLSTKWKVWTVAKMGTRKPLSEILDSIRARGYTINYSDNHPMDLLSLEKPLEFNKVEEFVYFAVASPRDLGLKIGWTRRQLLDQSLRKGLMPCLSGDILEILDQGKESLEKDGKIGFKSFGIAMEPITMESKNPGMFCIGNYYNGTKLHFGYWNGNLQDAHNVPSNLDNEYIFRIVNQI